MDEDDFGELFDEVRREFGVAVAPGGQSGVIAVAFALGTVAANCVLPKLL